MILYQRLWETMRRKNISQYQLIHKYQISSGQLARMRKNQHVSTHTIEMFCEILDCRVEEIMEYQKDGA
ncbi:MAG: helix-turn-helix transcriptional regulator [bacterium]|nr:helix-turn-helix transcriptional regulator [bacterium]